MKCLSTLFLLCVTVSVAVSQSAWKAEMYDQYDHESFASFAPANARIDFDNIDYALLNAAIFFETNRQRVLNGVAPGKYAVALEKIAFEHSYDMVKLEFFSHTSVIPEKADMSDRMASVGISNSAGAENIAITFGIEYEAGRSVYTPSTNGSRYFSYEYKGAPILPSTYNMFAKSALVQWMNSAGHRANILNGYAFMGCGGFLQPITSVDDFPKFKLTQNFASIAGNLDATIDYGSYRHVAVAPVQTTQATNAGSNNSASREDEVPARQRKAKKTGPKRFTIMLGGGGNVFLGTPGNFSLTEMSAGYEADGHLGYLYNNGKHSIGVFGRYGNLSGGTARHLAGTYNLLNEDDIAASGANSYLEIEGGFVFWRFLRLTAGSSVSTVVLNDGTEEQIRLGTGTLGFNIRFGAVRWFINGTSYFDKNMESFYLRPSTGLGVQFSMIRFR